MAIMKKDLVKILQVVPKDLSDIYSKCPVQFKQDYLDKIGISRDRFLELAIGISPNNLICGLFDLPFFIHTPDDFVYKNEYLYPVLRKCILNEKEMTLYNSLPQKFTQKEFRQKRLELNISIAAHDKMIASALFKHVQVDGQRYFDLEKSLMKPILK